MTLRQVLQCAQPIFFEDGFEGYEYSCGGTFFFVKFADKYFAITAKHCLSEREYKAIRLLRPSPSKQKEFIPFEVISVIEEPRDSFSDRADLAFIRLSKYALSASDKKASWFLDCDSLSKLNTTLAVGDGLGTKGYPFYAKYIDYEKGVIKIGAVACSGSYGGSDRESGIHKFKFSDLMGVPELNGFSGSPVFKIFQNERITSYWFAGVILQGTIESQIFHFVDHSVVFRALEILSREE